jgi:hypothetical protein
LDLESILVTSVSRAESHSDLERILAGLLSGGYAVGSDDRLLSTRQLVERLANLRIEIYPTEHAPPHFHLRGPGLNASFAIEDCRHLAGEIDGREAALVRHWHRAARTKLVKVWNATRPTDCPVGPIEITS